MYKKAGGQLAERFRGRRPGPRSGMPFRWPPSISSIEKGSCLPSRLTMLKLVPFIADRFCSLHVVCRGPSPRPKNGNLPCGKTGEEGRRVCARADRTGPRRCLLCLQLPKAEIRFSCPAGLLTDPFPRAPSRKRICSGLLPSVRRESQQRVLSPNLTGAPSFGRKASRRRNNVKVGTNPARLRSGPCKKYRLFINNYGIRLSIFLINKCMIAYGFVPVGGPGPA